ncbi:50S ribosomal protein L6 [candidate division WOR-3 bacterium]|nr:50S ribosomal protein L6 [candidate division WOR-3 bacterium]
MSRIGKLSIQIPDNVKVAISENKVRVEGPKGVLEQKLPLGIETSIENNELKVIQKSWANTPARRSASAGGALQGTIRTLINNMILGVINGYQRTLLIEGTGYRAKLQEKKLSLQVGYANTIVFPSPEGIELVVPEPQKIIINGIDKQLVGNVAAKIRAFRPPEPYKGKGIRYEGEQVKRKQGKKAIV